MTGLDELAEQVSALGGEARDRRDELEAGRRLPDDLYRKTAEHGLFRQLVPTELGGLGRSPLEWFATGVELATAEASYAWVVTQGAAALALVAGGGHPELVDGVLSDDRSAVSLSIAGSGSLTPADDDYEAAGRWAFGSGCHGATWLGGLAVVAASETPAPELRIMLVPASRGRIEASWDPIGMIGTGSDTIVIDAQRIPQTWTVNHRTPSGWDRGPISVAVGNGNWLIATSVAAIQLGTARRALDVTSETLPTKSPAPTFTPLSQNAAVQRGLMRAEAEWHSARAGVEQALDQLWREANDERTVSSETRVRLLLANAHANHASVRIVDACAELVGTAVVPARSTLAACLRDAHTLQGHISVNGATFEFAAQVHLGLVDSHALV